MKPQDIEDLKQLIEFLKKYQVAEFDLDRGDLKIRLKFAQPESSSAGLGDLARLLQSSPPPPAAYSAPAPSAQASAGRRTAHRQIAHRRHLLRFAFPRRFGLRLPRRSCRQGPGDLHRRGHEADERDRVRRRG
jgi:hypothetical protein